MCCSRPEVKNGRGLLAGRLKTTVTNKLKALGLGSTFRQPPLCENICSESRFKTFLNCRGPLSDNVGPESSFMTKHNRDVCLNSKGFEEGRNK